MQILTFVLITIHGPFHNWLQLKGQKPATKSGTRRFNLLPGLATDTQTVLISGPSLIFQKSSCLQLAYKRQHYEFYNVCELKFHHL